MKVLSLLSSGIDSPVASYLVSKKFQVHALHFKTSEKALEQVKKLCKKLKIKKLYIINYLKILKKITETCNRKYTCVLCKRIMYKIGEQIARKYNYKYLVTGENLSQVASQTLDNLITINKAVKIIILRPLLCYDKNEIIKIAKKIGTYEISIKTKESCSMVPKNPSTKSNLKFIEQEEKKLNLKEIINNSIKNL